MTPMTVPAISDWATSSAEIIARALSLGRAARMLEHDLGGLPVLVCLRVTQDQHRRRPVVPPHALGAREGHLRRGPAGELAGFERGDDRLRIAAAGLIGRLGENGDVAETIERRVDR